MNKFWPKRNKIGKLAILCVMGCFISTAFADKSASSATVSFTPKSEGSFVFFFHGEALATSLKNFCHSNGLKLVISPKLSRHFLAKPVTGRFVAPDVNTFLNTLANQYGFDWFIYSDALYITSLKDITASVAVSSDNMPDVRSYLEQMGLLNPKFAYTELMGQNKVMITGPDEYVHLVITKMGELGIDPINQQYALFRLKYANAVDTQLTFNNQAITIPGVASILQGLVGVGGGGKKTNVSTKVSEIIKNKVTASGVNFGGDNADGSNDGSIKNFAGAPRIQADPRLNTIIIRDKSSNLTLYRNIIKQLDVPAPLIQIDVLIVRLDQDKLAQKGINWWASAPNSLAGGFGVGNLLAGPSNALSASYGQINPGQLIVTNMGSFSASLQFLENNQYAKTEAKPSLATIDNLPAITSTIENIFSTNTAMTNTTSSNNPNSFAYNGIQLTQSLQITPHVIVAKDGGEQIKLSVVLQDGSVDAFSNPLMPNYSQGYISSQAVIKEGQSIILAGYTKNSTIKVENKVPGLGDIPGLGWLFKTSSTQVHRITTLYVVTPRVVADDYNKVAESQVSIIKVNKPDF